MWGGEEVEEGEGGEGGEMGKGRRKVGFTNGTG